MKTLRIAAATILMIIAFGAIWSSVAIANTIIDSKTYEQVEIATATTTEPEVEEIKVPRVIIIIEDETPSKPIIENRITKCKVNARLEPNADVDDGKIILDRGTTITGIMSEENPEWFRTTIDDIVYYIYAVNLVTEAEWKEMRTVKVNEDVPLSAELQQYLWESCFDAGIKYTFALAVMQRESDFRAKTIHYNTNGSIDRGLMQINSCNISKFKKLGYITCEDDLFDPYISIKCGICMLKQYVDQFGNCEQSYAAYNTGNTKITSNTNSKVVMQYWSEWINKLGDI